MKQDGTYEWCILASKRGENSIIGANMWNIAMGYLDYGETLEEGAVREAYEETNVAIDPKILHRENVTSSKRKNREDVRISFSAVLPGTIEDYNRPNTNNSEEGESTESRWIFISEVPKLNWALKQDKEILRLAKEILSEDESVSGNKYYKTIIASLKKLLSQNVIDGNTYEKIINLLKNNA